jgi:hypothetical protein
MAQVFYIKQNDTSPALLYELVPQPDSVAGASVVFNMRSGTNVKVNRGSGSVESSNPITLRYDWVVGDTDTVGEYEGEFEITYSDGSVGTWPNRGYIPVVISDDVG